MPTSRPVHPRACGEHDSTHSPEHQDQRFIPAHAGNTKIEMALGVMASVHPRACGEHTASHKYRKAPYGSSPRMRGTHLPAVDDPGKGRFIPAHAGNTRPARRSRPRRTVHPRACGEHFWALPLPVANCGSSPRMRGTPLGPLLGFGHGRFIPAHAGNTQYRRPGHTPGPVHPRACGEHREAPAPRPTLTGSSPRMRGTLPGLGPGGWVLRFIPAHAGNTR